MYVFDLKKLSQLNDNAPGVKMIARSGHARYILFSFQAGQGLQEHTTSSQIAVQILSGQVAFTARDETKQLALGHLLLLEADVPHTVQAKTEAIMLVIMTPDPQHHSLSDVLFDKIEPIQELD